MAESSVEVTWEDQRDINAFGRINSDHTLALALISEAKKQLEGLEEAQNELMLADDDDAARYLVGEVFVHTPNEDADDRITKEMERWQGEVDKLEAEKAEFVEQMAHLKQKLYAKFGDQINLEE